MAVIKRADAETRAHRPVSLDLGDLDRRGQMLREAAVAEAERIVREAHAGPTAPRRKGMTRCTSGPCSMMTTAPARNWKQGGSWA